MDLTKPALINLQKFSNEKGELLVLDSFNSYKFMVRRTYVLRNSKVSQRGDHGHKKLRQIIISLVGNHSITLHNGETEFKFPLNAGHEAVYVPAGFWRSIQCLTGDSVILVHASETYDSDDYLNTFEEFKSWVNNK